MKKIKKILLLVLLVLPLLLITACSKTIHTDFDKARIDFNNVYSYTVIDIEGYYYVGDNIIVLIHEDRDGKRTYIHVSVDNALLIKEE